MILSDRFGARLRSARLRHPQRPGTARLEALVRKAGGEIKAARINRIELGYADASPAEVALLARALGLTISDLAAPAPPVAAVSLAAPPVPAEPTPEVLAWSLPQRTSTQDQYTYRSILLQELGRIRTWLKKPGLRPADAAVLEGHRVRIEAAIAAAKVIHRQPAETETRQQRRR